MKQICEFALLLTVCLISVPQLFAGKDTATEKTIAALEQQWAEGQRDGNSAAVAPLLAEDFINTDTSGQIHGKDKLLSNLKGGKWEQNAINDVKVTVYGNTAIATGSWSGKGVDGDGAKIDRHERWTDTWVKMANGKWQCVASQQTEVKR
jgi:ketosteroid isomerase-like protein